MPDLKYPDPRAVDRSLDLEGEKGVIPIEKVGLEGYSAMVREGQRDKFPGEQGALIEEEK